MLPESHHLKECEDTALPCVELEPYVAADASVILLHGGGGHNREFVSLVQHFMPSRAHIRFVFPNAPQMSLTLFGGTRVRAWYDVRDADLQCEEDQVRIRKSAQWLEGLIERERGRNIAGERIVVGGFSQGGAIALYLAARYPQRLAGVIALSAYLPLMEEIRAQPAERLEPSPVFIGHGCADDLVSVSLAEQSARVLVTLGHPVRFKVFDTGHGVCSDEMHAVADWMGEIFTPPTGE